MGLRERFASLRSEDLVPPPPLPPAARAPEGSPPAPAAYAAVFDLRRTTHSDGRPMDQAYSGGHCDAMALALQRELGGDLVMLTDRRNPEGLVHVAVHKDGVVSDVDGHFPIGDWHQAWSNKFGRTSPLMVCHVEPALVEELMNLSGFEPRYLDDRRVDEARPLARALAQAKDLDPRGWWIEPSRTIPPPETLPVDADAAWGIALSHPRSAPSPAVPIERQPTRKEAGLLPFPPGRTGTDRLTAFEAFARMRDLQTSTHPTGRSNYEAFGFGRCHVLAEALRRHLGGELVALTPADRPDFLVHASVHRSGIMSDVSGHTPSGAWMMTWIHMRQGEKLAVRRTSVAELNRMMDDKPITPDELRAAETIARALAVADGVPRDAWRARLPQGAIAHCAHMEAPDARTAWDEALARKPLPYLEPVSIDPARRIAPTGLSKGPADGLPTRNLDALRRMDAGR